MAVQSIDALGPAKSRSVLIDAWLRPEEELLCVLAGKRIDHKDRFDGDTLIDLSDYVKNGILYWDIPRRVADFRYQDYEKRRRGMDERLSESLRSRGHQGLPGSDL